MQPSRLAQIGLFLILGSLSGLLFPSATLFSAPNESLTIGGVTYQVLELMSINGGSATFYTDQGPLLVKWAEIPPGVRQRFAKAFSEALDRSSAAAVAAYGAPVAIEGTIVGKVKEGTIVDSNHRRILLLAFPSGAAFVGTKISVISKRAGVMQVEDIDGTAKPFQAFTVLQLRNRDGESPAK